MDHLVLAWDIFPKEIILYMHETEDLIFSCNINMKD